MTFGETPNPCRRNIPRLQLSDAASQAQRVERLGQWFDDLAARETFNGAVWIAREGATLFAQHYGFADFSNGAPLTTRSSFSLASVSKQFTGMGILLLRQRGLLRLDDPLAKHIPELAFYAGVTLTHLLHHTSGLPDYGELAERNWDPARLLTQNDLITLLATLRPQPYFAPGAQYEYSNTGYALLGGIIARVSRTSFAAFMATEIFDPLHMRDSAAFNLSSPSCPLRERAFGFTRHGGGLDPVEACDLNNLDGTFGDGGIYSSAADLVRWDAALREGRLLPADIYREAYAPGRLNGGRTVDYGFGWEIVAPHIVKHWGEWEGFSAYVWRNLEAHTLLVLLSNLGPPACVDAMTHDLDAFMQSLRNADNVPVG
jgi:CubicO group peptidase (beta-lactamase class C family)